MALNEITKGMSNAAEMINDNFKMTQIKEDTGWVDVVLKNVEGASTAKMRRVNGMVMLEGQIYHSTEVRSPLEIGDVSALFNPVEHLRIYGVPSPIATTFPETHAVVVSITKEGKLLISAKTAVKIFNFQISRIAN